MSKLIKVYSYSGCETCRKALKWLKNSGIEFENLSIRETPPNRREIKSMLGYYDGQIRKLFNVSGQDYRRLDLKSSLPGMSELDAISLLASNGNLVKRPFVLGQDAGVVGFNSKEWEQKLKVE